MVSPNLEFFHAAFGQNKEDFVRIASMPEHYIIHRFKYNDNQAADWTTLFKKLTPNQKNELYCILDEGRVTQTIIACVKSERLKKLLAHYIDEDKLTNNPQMFRRNHETDKPEKTAQGR